MSVRDQTLLLVHEGLRRIVFEHDYDKLSDVDFAAITNGLENALALFNEQLQGSRRKLHAKEISGLEQLALHILKITNRNFTGHLNDYFMIWPNGGGFVFKNYGNEWPVVKSSAFLGAGTRIAGGAITIGERTEVLGSSIYCNFRTAGSNCSAGNDVKIQTSTITGWFAIADEAQISFSELSLSEDALNIIGRGSILDQTKIANLLAETVIDSGVILKNLKKPEFWAKSKLYTRFIRKFRIERLEFNAGSNLDFANRALCKSGSNYFSSFAVIKNADDLTKLCE
ncbi:hypothetical protein WDW86_21960 [Bdellovibrionota bacterium FG-2]